jgi:hypothetical protein
MSCLLASDKTIAPRRQHVCEASRRFRLRRVAIPFFLLASMRGAQSSVMLA